MDVSSLYTNIDTDEGLTIVQEQIGKTNQNKPSVIENIIMSPRWSSQSQQFHLS